MKQSSLLGALRQAFSEMVHHKLRTLLTLLGMVFGVGAVIAMLSIGEGAQREALNLIDSMGLRNLLVQAKRFDRETLKENRKDSLGLSIRDMNAAIELPLVEAYSAEKQVKTYDLFSAHSGSDGSVFAVTPSHFSLSSLQIAQGRLFDEQDNQRFAQVAVVGWQSARELFPDGDALGGYIKVNHLWLEVIGVLAEKHLGKEEFQGVKLGDESNRIYLPLQTAFKRLRFDSLEDEIDAFRLRMAEQADPQVTAQALSHLLTRRHGEVDDFELVIPAALLAQQRQTQQIFTIVMSCIAGISLLVGGIGIMNIMLATVLERTKEIGLLRAIGARKADIRQQFVVESFVISAVGALIGIIFGIALAMLIQVYADWSVAWAPSAVLLAVSICLATGVIFGWYPAARAAELDPIRALHTE